MRIAVLAVAAFALTACGGTKLGAPRCTAGQLAFVGSAEASEATGQHTTPFLFKNVSKSACVLSGYPTIRLFGAHGAELPFTYTRNGDTELPSLRPRPVRIAPGGEAVFIINKYRCDILYLDRAKSALITFPGGAGSRLVGFPGLGGADYCKEAPSLKIDVTPILPSLANARR